MHNYNQPNTSPAYISSKQQRVPCDSLFALFAFIQTPGDRSTSPTSWSVSWEYKCPENQPNTRILRSKSPYTVTHADSSIMTTWNGNYK